jgi:lipopolysaccharide/colanic/teichoic acid biosynthesis glycosyltransferase
MDQRAGSPCKDAVDARPPAAAYVQPSATSRRQRRLMDASCRALDLVGAAVLLVMLAPLLSAIALLIRLDSPGPILFRQQRIGRNRRPFTVNKFRTMYDGADEEQHREFVIGLINGDEPQRNMRVDDRPDSNRGPGFYYKMIADTRVTRFGRFLRRSSLDELPQLWNVLRGEMSLVGPRPPIPYEVEQYPSHWFARFAVKPGVTGLWQVSGRSDVTLEEMVALDVEYILRRSLGLNLLIILRTVPAVLSARGAW